jgi:hypothetical protein
MITNNVTQTLARINLHRRKFLIGGFASLRTSLFPAALEVPFLQLVYASVIHIFITFAYTFMVMNFVISILLDTYSSLRPIYASLGAEETDATHHFPVCPASPSFKIS